MLKQAFEPAKLNGLTLKNRFIKAGTFEGMSPNGLPSDNYLRFHQQIAQGGVAMTTLGYCATEADGRINENMLYMDEYLRPSISAIIDDLHQAGTKVSGQMGHCGGFSKNKELQRKRPRGPQFGINILGVAEGMFFTDKMSHADIDEMVQSYHDAAVFMKSVGFDCVEIHFGHGYGLCQFMSPKTNKRKDEYGGTLPNRMRLPLRVLAAVRKALGDDFPIIGKISLTEGVRGGLHYDDAIEIGKLLDAGGIDGLVTSGGTSTMNPMIMFRGDNMLPALLKAEKNPLMKLILRMVGPAMFRDYDYHELYFMAQAKRLRDAVQCKMIYVGGASCSESFATLMQEGFDFIQLGRGLLADSDLVNKAQIACEQERAYQSRCVHCNECIATIEHVNGIHCTRFE